jgi:hypothetical protein
LRGWWGSALPKNPPALPSNSLASPCLLLIGVVHGDPQGYERAMKLLRRFQPELVTVEVSRFSLRYRQRQEGCWQRLLQQALEDLPAAAAEHLAIRRLMAQVSLPFEVRAARDYSRQYATPWRPLDLGAPSRRHLPRYARELLSPENLKALLATEDAPLEDCVAREYYQARLAGERPRWRPLGSSPETRLRERLQARRLRQHLARYGRVAHLGGWEHLVSWQDGTGMWEDLANLKPWRLLLDEADEKINLVWDGVGDTMSK